MAAVVVLLLALGAQAGAAAEVPVAFDGSLRPAAFGADKLRAALSRAGAVTAVTSLESSAALLGAPQTILVGAAPVDGAAEGSFTIDRMDQNATRLQVTAVDVCHKPPPSHK